MLSILVFVHTDLAVLGPIPVKAVRSIFQVAAQGAHDASVAGDKHIFIILLFKILHERDSSCLHRCNGLNGRRGREDPGHDPVGCHCRTKQIIFALFVFSEVGLYQTGIHDDFGRINAADDRSCHLRALEGAGVDGVKVDIVDIFAGLPGLRNSLLIERALYPSLHSSSAIEISLSVTGDPDFHI